EAGQQGHNLAALELASGQTTSLTNFDPEHSLAHDFSVSPDETQIAYVDWAAGKSRIFVRPLRGGAPRQVTRGEEDGRSPAWFPDSQKIAFCSTRTGIYQIYLARLDGREPEQMTVGESDYQSLAVSPDGSKIIVTSEKE